MELKYWESRSTWVFNEGSDLGAIWASKTGTNAETEIIAKVEKTGRHNRKVQKFQPGSLFHIGGHLEKTNRREEKIWNSDFRVELGAFKIRHSPQWIRKSQTFQGIFKYAEAGEGKLAQHEQWWRHWYKKMAEHNEENQTSHWIRR